jgi:hypothetical protein
MAYYAFLNANKIVTEVIVGRSEDETVDGITDWELYYGEFRGQACVQTSYTGDFRFNYAGIGFSYDATLDAFIPPTPYPSWVLDEATCTWVAPTPKPDGDYVWDEQAGDWVEA